MRRRAKLLFGCLVVPGFKKKLASNFHEVVKSENGGHLDIGIPERPNPPNCRILTPTTSPAYILTAGSYTMMQRGLRSYSALVRIIIFLSISVARSAAQLAALFLSQHHCFLHPTRVAHQCRWREGR
ncbi:hypothetical protein L208DRAFT_1383346 [Tricholoma matsutake]|nr:hypothetical protein L208DRAFT_1383346 [Tricholoma matsutake 945]